MEVDQKSEDSGHLLSFLAGQESIKLTTKIERYTNPQGSKCVNEFEIVESLGRGLMWKVKKVKRYYYDSNNQIQFKLFALKKAHIKTLKQMRYYQNDECKNYFDKVITEIKIHLILNSEDSFPRLYEIMYDPSSEEDYNYDNQYIFLVLELCDEGPLMIKNFLDMKYYYNYNHLKHLCANISPNYFEELNQIVSSQKQKDKDATNAEFAFVPIEKKIDFEFIKKYMKEVFPSIISSLQILHENHIIYSDLKPENICLKQNDGRFEVKLLDFSISSIFNKKASVSNSGGTVYFQAPEQIESQFDGIKSDIWSLGILISVFLSCEYPIEGNSEIEVQLKCLRGEFKFPQYFDEEIIDLLKWILQTDPLKRPSLAEIKQRIEQIK